MSSFHKGLVICKSWQTIGYGSKMNYIKNLMDDKRLYLITGSLTFELQLTSYHKIVQEHQTF